GKIHGSLSIPGRLIHFAISHDSKTVAVTVLESWRGERSSQPVLRRSLLVWKIEEASPFQTYTQEEDHIGKNAFSSDQGGALAFSPDDQTILYGRDDGTVLMLRAPVRK